MPITATDKPVRRRWVVAIPAEQPEFGPAPYPSRHATSADYLLRDLPFLTLAGERVVLADEEPGRPAPECRLCDHAWRVAEGIEQRDEHRPARR